MKCNHLIALLICLLLGSLSVELQATDQNSKAERVFSDSTWQELRESAAYKDTYKHKTPVDVRNPISEFIMKMLVKLLGNRVAAFIFSVIPYVLILLAVALIIFKFYQLEPKILFRKNKHLKAEVIHANSEDIYQMDIDALLEEALKNKQNRLVVRFSYLKVLRLLSDAQLIKWKLHKSNIDYQIELRGTSYFNAFTDCTRFFDFIWYGNQLPEGINEGNIITHFKTFIEQLKEGKELDHA